MAVVAHPDDDLLFLNPDLDAGIRAGIATTVVYLSAGDAGLPPADAAVRVRNRQRGVMDAYRVSGGAGDLPLQDEWDGRVLSLGGRQVEEFTLRERPGVRLVFLGLPDGLLDRLLSGATLSTVAAADGLVTQSQPYDEGDVVTVLRELLRRYRPAVLRLTEFYADRRYDVPPSHPDHRVAAAFAAEAARQYRILVPTWLPYTVEHRDYGIAQHPVNLDVTARARKRVLFVEEYQPWDPASSDAYGWTAREYYRSSRGTQWSAVDGDGAAYVFAVRDGRVLAWRGPGTWRSIGELGDGVTTVAAARAVDGAVHLAARTDDSRIMVRPARSGGWTSLGTPNPGDDSRYIGSPALASNADGRLQVFVVNAAGGLSTRWQSGGGWAPWFDLQGSDLQDPCSALLDASGRIEVVAATRTGLILWRQTVPNGGIVRGPIPALPPASAATFAVNADGRPEVHYREAGTAAVATSWQDADFAWRSTARIGGHGGIGAPATATVAGRIAVAVRNAGGGVSVAMQVAPNSPYGAWIDLGGHVADLPTAAATPDGRLVVAAVHADGNVRHRTRSAAGSWTAWTTIGPPV
jgi:LmbE family N-acetylglucosaminyl deacetylase